TQSGEDPDTHVADPAGVLVYLDVSSVVGADFSVGARVSVYPGSDYVDANGHLTTDMVVDVSPSAADKRLDFSAGTAAGPIPTTIYADGDVRTWPFDRYAADSVTVRVFQQTDGQPTEVPAVVVVTDSLTNWNVDAGPSDPRGGESFDITVARTAVSKIYDSAICLVLLVLPSCALFVAVNTIRRRKKFQPPMVTWFAVMLFAVLPIRNLLPDAPPIGSWVDYAIILWVVLGLVIAMMSYVYAWFRDAP
ncbi:MAG: DUF4436 family protein, partial [Rhodococcus sp. (in: high G+C Gram-positive bacteria)]